MNPKKRGKLLTKSIDQIDDCYVKSSDWINKLPDALLVNIISLLPLEQAVQTSILSRRWKHLWKSIHNVQLSYIDMDKWRHFTLQDCADHAVCAMETFLCRHQASKIKRFNILITAHGGNAYLVDSWVLFALSHGVEEFLFTNSGYHRYVSRSNYGVYKIPSCVFQSQRLTELRLVACEVQMPSSVCLPFLKTLVFEDLINTVDVEFIISKCPSLESLSILRCLNLSKRLVISVGSSHFRSLIVSHSSQIVIDAPNVQSLELQSRFVPERDYLLGNLSSLTRVYLNLAFFDLRGVVKMLEDKLSHVRHVKLSEDCILALSCATNLKPIMATCLELVISLTTTTNLRRIRTVISFFPGVQRLILVFKMADEPLTRQKCWKSVKNSVSKLLQHIKIFEMHEFISCRTISGGGTLDDIWQTCEVKIELVRIVLEKSTCLDRVAIILSNKWEFNQWEGKPQFKLKLTKKLEDFQRASSAAKIFVF